VRSASAAALGARTEGIEVKYLRLVVLGVAFSWVCSCSSEQVGPVNEPRIRVSNLTELALSDVHVVLPGEEVAFGPIPAGGTTGYIAVHRAYADACVQAEGNQGTVVLFHCWVDDEEPPTVPNADYTIEMHLTGLRVVRDDG
jgi:hypothetical protein